MPLVCPDCGRCIVSRGGHRCHDQGADMPSPTLTEEILDVIGDALAGTDLIYDDGYTGNRWVITSADGDQTCIVDVAQPGAPQGGAANPFLGKALPRKLARDISSRVFDTAKLERLVAGALAAAYEQGRVDAAQDAALPM